MTHDTRKTRPTPVVPAIACGCLRRGLRGERISRFRRPPFRLVRATDAAWEGSPNFVPALEQHVEWISDFLASQLAEALTTFEPEPAAQDAWVAHVNEVAAATLMPQANSWYMGANVPGKPQIFMPYAGGVGHYRHLCADIAARGYPGFARSR